jgi:CheY-like chemotaxis protein
LSTILIVDDIPDNREPMAALLCFRGHTVLQAAIETCLPDAHDFNNRLTAILGYCELLIEDAAPDDPRAVQHLAQLALERVRGERLVQQGHAELPRPCASGASLYPDMYTTLSAGRRAFS